MRDARHGVQPSTVPLPAKAARYQSLDVWRGGCCLALVCFHGLMQVVREGAASSGGLINDIGYWLVMVGARLWVGVPIFFVISGYCIMATLDSRRRKPAAVLDYVKRRFWRIYPPYWFALGLSVVAIALVEGTLSPGLLADGMFTVPRPWTLSVWQWLGNLSLTETWRHCLMGGAGFHILPNTWTLGYEEQFYLVAGLMLLLAPKRIFAATAVVTALTLAGKVAAYLFKLPVEGSLFDGRWLLVAAGILVYYRINYATAKQVKWVHLLLAGGILLAAKDPSTLLTLEPNHAIERFVGFSFALLLSSIYRYDKQIMAFVPLRPLAVCGSFSYSIYLVHPLITKGISHGLFRWGIRGHWETVLVTIPLCVAASLVAAAGFYWLVERRFANSKPAPIVRGTSERTLNGNATEIRSMPAASDFATVV